MPTKHILILGSGETSRANVDALLDDYFFNKKDNYVIVLAFNKQASQGQAFAAQFAKDNNKELVIFANEDFISAGLPQSTVNHSNTPVKDAISSSKGIETEVFMLWSDEDMETANIISLVSEAGMPAFDLTDGLSKINVSKNVKTVEAPSMPEVEATTAKEEHPSLFDEEEEEESDDEEEYEEVDDDAFAIAEAISSFASLVAKEVVKELKKTEPK